MITRSQDGVWRNARTKLSSCPFRFSLTALLLVLLTPGLRADTPIPTNISTDTTWTAAASPYVAANGITINAGVTLTIEAGVTAKFPASAYLLVRGKVSANGTSANPITLTSTGTAWNGIEFVASTLASQLTYVTVLNAGVTGWTTAAISITDVSPSLTIAMFPCLFPVIRGSLGAHTKQRPAALRT